MGTRLLSSSDNISETLLGTLGLTNQDWVCLTMYTFAPCLQFFCLFKPITHVCTLNMAEDGLSAHSASSHDLSQAV
jgi:hypothetical protein